jgi:hypothetical protein
MKDQKLFVANASFPATAYDGVITISKAVPEADKVDVVRSITYDQSVVHEIFTYWDSRAGFHNSAFSPEDLVSNFLGTYVAGIALKGKGSFNAAATKALNDLMTALNARPPAGTTQAFNKIAGVYVTAPNDYLKLRFLKRRNFNVKEISPCIIPGITGCTSTTFPSTIPRKFDDRIKTYYDLEFTTPDDFFARRFSKARAKIGVSLKLSGFDAAIDAIKADAAIIPDYGPNFGSCAL